MERTRRILALDMANKTGWAARTIGGAVESGMEFFGFCAEETMGSRFRRFEDWINGKWRTGVDAVVIEQAHHRSGPTTHQALGMQAIVELRACKGGADVYSVHSATLKKYATGSGRADKSAMIAAAKAKWPEVEIVDDNHADALWLLDYYESVLDPAA